MKLFCLIIVAQFSAFTDSNLRDINLEKNPVKGGEKILHIKKDSTVFIKLKSLSTSGYRWSYSIGDSSVVKVEKRGNEFPAKQPKHEGDSGLEVFAVKGLRNGETKIHFEQKRPWKNAGNPIKYETYIVKVD